MNTHKESKAVRAVMENYMKGTYEADEALLKSVFHEKAIMNGFLGSQTVLADPSAFIADMMSAPSMKSQGDAYQAEIEQIRIDGDIAFVTVSETGFRGSGKLVDHFHLIKLDGEWKVISKLFTTV